MALVEEQRVVVRFGGVAALVEHARLAAATGIPFVQLSVPATGPGEQLLILDWYLRHHPTP
ncbi:hypothetical protein FV229_23800, partial [Methylobacterium sp. WL120]